jgi:hypothetical protein
MSARRFNYFDDWKDYVLECPKCRWSGKFEQGAVEYFAELMDCCCPQCNSLDAPMLAIVSYPTLQELRANQDKPGIREYVERIDAGFDRFEREKLREPGQLLEINEDSFALTWDFDASNPDDERTLIKHGDTVVFSEPARWEESERFHQIAEILKQKYGNRISDLIPTERSEMRLWGDKSTAPDYVESVRDKLREQSRVK